MPANVVVAAAAVAAAAVAAAISVIAKLAYMQLIFLAVSLIILSRRRCVSISVYFDVSVLPLHSVR
jgi:hypothetical protein